MLNTNTKVTALSGGVNTRARVRNGEITTPRNLEIIYIYTNIHTLTHIYVCMMYLISGALANKCVLKAHKHINRQLKPKWGFEEQIKSHHKDEMDYKRYEQ